MLPPLLVLPFLAVRDTVPGPAVPWVAAYAGIVSCGTMLAYAHDKRQAISGGRRTPERTLHLMELLGGWPGAFVMQRVIRHKCVPGVYAAVFWAIVAVHQWGAWIFLRDRGILQSLGMSLPT